LELSALQDFFGWNAKQSTVSAIQQPGIDECDCHSVPEQIHVPALRSQLKAVLHNECIQQVYTTHRLVVLVDNEWPVDFSIRF